MHPLLPDDFTFRSIETDEVLQERTFRELGALDTRARLDEVGFVNSFYSLGIAHPGAITLHNYPRFLQEFKRPDGTVVDLAATDVLRIRERGVPRYNEFRRLFHLKPAATFEELTDNPEWAKELRRVYGDVERVDLMVGLYAEPLPKGFGFSDTAFRVFILMASRRLKSDRFFTSDYNAETYTQAGLDWIDETTMIDVLKRHYPELEPALRGVDNAFAPWTRTGGDGRRRLGSPCGRARGIPRDRDPGHRHARTGHGADDPERPARRPAWRRCDGARDRVRDRVLDGRGERRSGGAARRLRAGLRRAQARRSGLPRLPRPAGAPPSGPRRAPPRRRLGAHARLAPRRAFQQGLLSNLGNPKIAVFFTSLLPQFGSSFWSMLALGLLFCSLGLVWLSAYALAVARAGDLLRRPRIRQSLDALTGTLLVAFGIRLAAER